MPKTDWKHSKRNRIQEIRSCEKVLERNADPALESCQPSMILQQRLKKKKSDLVGSGQGGTYNFALDWWNRAHPPILPQAKRQSKMKIDSDPESRFDPLRNYITSIIWKARIWRAELFVYDPLGRLWSWYTGRIYMGHHPPQFFHYLGLSYQAARKKLIEQWQIQLFYHSTPNSSVNRRKRKEKA